MKATINIEITLDEIEGKSRDNLIFTLTKIIKDITEEMDKMKCKSDFNLSVNITKVSIKSENKEVSFSKKNIPPFSRIYLN